MSNGLRIATFTAAVLLWASPSVAQERQHISSQSAASTGWLGISFDEIQTRGQSAMVVRQVHPRSPAQWARLQPRDTVVRVNGREASRAAFADLRLQPGDTVRFIVRRGKWQSTMTDTSRVNGTLRGRIKARRGPGTDREVLVVAAQRPTTGLVLRPLGFDTLNIDPADIRSVEVLRGAAAMERFGADAKHGVIRIVTPDGEQIVRIPSADSIANRLRGYVFQVEPELRRAQDQLRRSGPELERQSATARALALDLESGRRAVAGAEFAELNVGLADYFRGVSEGLLVLRVSPETPAGRAGLQAGDVVTRVEGQRIAAVSDLRRIVAAARNGEAKLDVVRKGRAMRMTLRWSR